MQSKTRMAGENLGIIPGSKTITGPGSNRREVEQISLRNADAQGAAMPQDLDAGYLHLNQKGAPLLGMISQGAVQGINRAELIQRYGNQG